MDIRFVVSVAVFKFHKIGIPMHLDAKKLIFVKLSSCLSNVFPGVINRDVTCVYRATDVWCQFVRIENFGTIHIIALIICFNDVCL